MPATLPETILIGTRNKAKVDMIMKTFPAKGIKFLSLNEIEPINDSSLVEGMDFVENAKMKAKFYYEKTGIPTLSTDQIQWLENWPEDKGFIMHIRKLVNPNVGRASDDEVIAWIKNFVKEHGPSKAIFHFGIAYACSHGVTGYDVPQREYILQGERSATIREEYVFDQFMKDPETGAYRVDQPDTVSYDHLARFWKETFIPELQKQHA